ARPEARHRLGEAAGRGAGDVEDDHGPVPDPEVARMAEVAGGDLLHVGEEALDGRLLERGEGAAVVAEVPQLVEDAEADQPEVARGQERLVDARVDLRGARPPIEGEEVDAEPRGP